jgi:hypothetical protein
MVGDCRIQGILLEASAGFLALGHYTEGRMFKG